MCDTYVSSELEIHKNSFHFFIHSTHLSGIIWFVSTWNYDRAKPLRIMNHIECKTLDDDDNAFFAALTISFR